MLTEVKRGDIHTYIHTYIRVFCIAHINSIESLYASAAKQISFQRLFESVKIQERRDRNWEMR